MRAHALNGVVASGHFGDDGVVIVGVEPSAIADLSAGFGVEGRVIEDDLAGVAGLEFLRTLAAFDDGEHFAVVGASLAIAFEVGFRKLLVGRISRLLGCAFPGGASALALLGHGAIKTFPIKHDALIPAGVLDEIPWQPERVVKPEGGCTTKTGSVWTAVSNFINSGRSIHVASTALSHFQMLGGLKSGVR